MRIVAALAGAALALQFYLLYPWLGDTASDFDALHLYLPLARELAAHGLAFLADERSLQAPPFAFAWTALLGGDLGTIKLANYALSGVTLLLAFRIAWLLHSPAAGAAAALLFAASPLMKPFLATAVTEPPFAFLGLAWTWAVCEAVVGGRRRYLAVAAVAFALAALTRASFFYLCVALALGCLGLAWVKRGKERRLALALAAAHGAAFALVAAFIARSLWYFDFPFFATGAGNALYLGASPLTGGYDSNYLGVIYDVGSIVQQPSHLTLSAERLLRPVASLVLVEQPPLQLAAAWARKTAAFLFVTNAEANVVVLRAWRIALLSLGVVGLFAIRHAWLRLLLAATLAYQVAVHVPVLYTHRYSVGAIDPWLAVLAGVGVASLWRNPRGLLVATTFTVAAIAVGTWHARRGDLPEPDVFRAARMPIWEGTPLRMPVEGGRATAEIPVRDAPRFHPWNNHVLVVDAVVPAGACGPLRASYRRLDQAAWSAAVPRRFEGGEGVERHQWGGVPLGLNAEGTLRLEADCAADASIDIRRLAVYSPMGGLDARERYLGEKPRFPLER